MFLRRKIAGGIKLQNAYFLLTGVVLLCFSGCGSNSSGSPPPPPVHNEWAWWSGSNTVNPSGSYGIQGVPSAGNTPGARVSPVAWKDSSGNFWLFGGYGVSSESAINEGDLSDLWEYSPTTHEWTWVNGSDQIEQSGSYGIEGATSPDNHPGARWEAASWVGLSGDFWLYGGEGIDSTGTRGRLYDLWKYDPSTNEWTWMNGSKTVAQLPGEAGVYGTKDVPSPANHPGALWDAATWTGPAGNLWLFGGNGTDSTGAFALVNVLWKYDPSTNEWTWVSGSKIGDQLGTYGSKDVPSLNNVPGARFNAMSWTDAQGNLWLFGGVGMGASPSSCTDCYLDDLWKYNISTNEWTWVGGSDEEVQPGVGVYGTEGTADPGNIPPDREAAVTWTDPSGNFWLFGGDGGPSFDYNDLWKYDPTTNEWTWVSGSDQPGQTGIYGGQAYRVPVPSPAAVTRLWAGSTIPGTYGFSAEGM